VDADAKESKDDIKIPADGGTVDAATAVPALKSAKKKRRAATNALSKSPSVEGTTKEAAIAETKAVAGGISDAAVAATPPKSVKKKKNSAPDDDRKVTVDADAKESKDDIKIPADGGTIDAATDLKSAKKKRKAAANAVSKSPRVEGTIKETAIAAVGGSNGIIAADFATPVKKSSKKKKNATAGDSKANEQPKVKVTVPEKHIAVAADGRSEDADEADVVSPAEKPAKTLATKKRTATKEGDPKETVHSAGNTKGGMNVANNGIVGVYGAIDAATSPRSAKKKKKKHVTECVSKLIEQPQEAKIDASATMDVISSANSVQAKSPGEKKKKGEKRSKKSEDVEEDKPHPEETPKRNGRSVANKRVRTNLDEEKEEPTSAHLAAAATLERMGKHAIKKLRKINPDAPMLKFKEDNKPPLKKDKISKKKSKGGESKSTVTCVKKSAKKKKKKNATDGDSKANEQPKVKVNDLKKQVAVPADGGSEDADEAHVVVSPAEKPTKKKRSGAKKGDPRETVHSAGNTKEGTNVAINGIVGVDGAIDAATSPRSAKKKKKHASERVSKSATMDVIYSANSVPAESPRKKKKREKRRKKSEDVEEDKPLSEETPNVTGNTAVANKRHKTNPEEKGAKEEPAPAHLAAAATSEKMSKHAIKKLRKTNPDDPRLKSNEVNKPPPKKDKASKKKSKGGDHKSTTKKPHKKRHPRKHDRPKSRKASKEKKMISSPVKPQHPPPLAMDVKVHRMRFLKLHPKSILAMSSTPMADSSNVDVEPSQEPRSPVRLAVSREGGSVELLSPHDRWVSVGDVPGVRGREVDALVWVCGKQGHAARKSDAPESLGSRQSHRMRVVDENRHLFGCSRDGTIFKLDFATKRQTGVIGSGGGGVFCMASMCSRWNGSASREGYFAAGCEDGTIKVYSVFDGDGEVLGMPNLVATLPSAGNAILSLAWVPGQSRNVSGDMGGSVIFAGVADGTIRRFDCTTSAVTGPISTGTVLAPSRGSGSVSYRWKSTLRMTVESRGLREATKVWALQALSDGTVISGDSLGHVQIWDGMSGTMTQTFDHNESGADVLCLAVSEDENKIFASGIDSSVRCIQRQCLPPISNPQNDTSESAPVRKWISSNSHRKHSHDVKALAICHKEKGHASKSLELLVSGGIDTRICTYVANDFKSSRPKIWYNWPSISRISLSRTRRLLAVMRDNRIDLYRLNSSQMADPLKVMNPETRDEMNCLVKTISIQSPFNLSCSVISDDGKFLAASDAVSLYIFSLDIKEEDGMLEVRPTKLGLGVECKHPATALQFDDNRRLICATNNGPINILKISSVPETDLSDKSSHKVSLEHVFNEHTVDWSATSHHLPIVSLGLSPDGKWLAACRFSSGKGAVHVFNLPTSNDNEFFKHWWSVPEMDAPTTCIKFLGGGSVEPSLAVGCSNNEFYVYNLGRRSLSHWSNDMGLPLLKSLPKELTSRSEPVARILSNPSTPQRFILGSHGYFCVVDLDQPVPERSSMFPLDHLRAKRLQLIKEDDMPRPPGEKRKSHDAPVTNSNFTICLRYSEIMFQDFIAENEMVIVEEPWMSILEELPDALARRVYGT